MIKPPRRQQRPSSSAASMRRQCVWMFPAPQSWTSSSTTRLRDMAGWIARPCSPRSRAGASKNFANCEFPDTGALRNVNESWKCGRTTGNPEWSFQSAAWFERFPPEMTSRDLIRLGGASILLRHLLAAMIGIGNEFLTLVFHHQVQDLQRHLPQKIRD